MKQPETIWARMNYCGLTMGNHESDLYVQDTQTARDILDMFPTHKANARRFVNQAPPHAGEVWIDIPFAYDPWWNAKQSANKA